MPQGFDMAFIDPVPAPPPLPTPTSVAIWAGQIRAILPLLGGIGLGGAWVAKLTDAQINDYVTATLTFIGIASWIISALWSRYSKWEAARADHASSVASAVASANRTAVVGTPTPVTVAPSPITGAATATPVPLADVVSETASPPKAA
jgi:predicted lipid-binding transport protein (Tim44 family)